MNGLRKLFYGPLRFGIMWFAEEGGSSTGGGREESGGGGSSPWYGDSLNIAEIAGEGADQNRIEAMSTKLSELGGIQNLAKSYFEQEKAIGKKGILIPGEKASDEERSAFESTLREHLGISIPDEYSWEPPEDMADRFSKEAMKDQLDQFRQAGYTDEQAKVALNQNIEAIKAAELAMQDAQKEMAEESKKKMAENWGDKAEERFAGAQKFMERFPNAVEKLARLGLANDYDVLEIMDVAARSSIEGKPLGGDGDQKGIDEQLAELKGSEAYTNGRHPDHKTVFKRVQSLQRRRVAK